MSIATEFVTPRFFLKQNRHPYLRVDDFSYVQYRSSTEQYRNRIIVTSYLFVVLLSGRKIIHTAEGDLEINAGEAFWARQGSYLFSEVPADQQEYRTIVFFIDDAFLRQFLERYCRLIDSRPPERRRDIFKIPVSPLLDASITSILPYFLHQSDLSRPLLRLKLEELLLHIIASEPDGNFVGFLQDLYKTRKREMQDLMEKYFLKPMTIAELAMLSGRSLSVFKREFKQTFNTSPRAWITNRRLEYARILLSGSDLNVSEICFTAGFENFSHFSQIFKKKYGVPPSILQKSRN